MFHRKLFMKYKYQNTRRYLRLPAPWPIKCEPKTEANGKHVMRAEDVGAGGVRIVLGQELPAGSRLHLEIHVPPLNRSIRAEGKVVRCLPKERGFELGIRFERIDPRDQAALNEAVERFFSPRQRIRQHRAWRREIS